MYSSEKVSRRLERSVRAITAERASGIGALGASCKQLPGRAGDIRQEGALILVIDGDARVEAGNEFVDARVGDLFRFDPDERRTVTTDGGARLLLVLAPWPGEGHYRGEAAVSASA